MIQRRWRNLRLQNQILIIQGVAVVVAVVLAILIVLSYELVSRFSVFIKHELFQTLILKSTLQINSQLDDCLMSEYSQEFYSYQFCYGIYGQENNQGQTYYNQINDFISLQNLFIPLCWSSKTNVRYNILMDESLFFAQYKGKYVVTLDQYILDAFNLMITYDMPAYLMDIQDDNVKMILQFTVIPGTKIGIGTLQNNSEDEFNKISQQDSFFNQRWLFVTEDGEIFYDSWNSGPMISFENIQDPGVIGFDAAQFEKIKNFTQNLSVDHECDFNVQNQFFCLMDQNGQLKMIQSSRSVVDYYVFYYILVLDAKSSLQTVNDFDEQLKESVGKLVSNITMFLIVILVVCFMLQIFLIRKLNEPLQDLQDIAKFHINNEQYQMLTVIKVIKQQFQIQQLADSFFNLINLNQKTRSQKSQQIKIKNKKMKHISGLIQQRYQFQRILQIRKVILALRYKYN